MAEAEEEHREAQSKEKAEHRQHKSFKQGRKQGKEYESSSSSSSEEEAEDEEEAEEDDDGDDGDNGDSSSKADAKGKQKKQKRRKEMKKKQHQKKQHQKKKHQKKKQNRVRINPCLVILNLLLACVGIGFIGVGLWMALNHGTNCVHFLQTFLIGSGLIMLAIAASGIAGAVFRLLWLLYLNFIVMLLLLLLIVGTTVFVLIITGHGISASFRAEHSSNGSAQGGRNPLSSWIRDRVNERIRACTQNGQICNFVQYSYSTGYYSRPRLSDLQVLLRIPHRPSPWLFASLPFHVRNRCAAETLECGSVYVAFVLVKIRGFPGHGGGVFPCPVLHE
jgi:cation transport ATPase